MRKAFFENLMAYHHKSAAMGTMTSSASVLLLLAVFTLHAHVQVRALAQELPDHVQAESDQSKGSTFTNALRQELMTRGMSLADVDSILYAVGARILHMGDLRSYKRAGWKRIPIQTRFAPFGTKLVPSRNRGESNGPTLLRYGRSSYA